MAFLFWVISFGIDIQYIVLFQFVIVFLNLWLVNYILQVESKEKREEEEREGAKICIHDEKRGRSSGRWLQMEKVRTESCQEQPFSQVRLSFHSLFLFLGVVFLFFFCVCVCATQTNNCSGLSSIQMKLFLRTLQYFREISIIVTSQLVSFFDIDPTNFRLTISQRSFKFKAYNLFQFYQLVGVVFVQTRPDFSSTGRDRCWKLMRSNFINSPYMVTS